MASQRAVRAAKAFVEITGDDSKLRKVLSSVKGTMKTLAVGAAAAATAGIAAVAASAAGAAAAVFRFAAAGDKLEKMSQRTGVSAEALSQLGFAAEQSGSDLDTLGASLFRMQRRVANFTTGGGPAKRALEELGFAADSFAGLSTEQTFGRVVDALQEVSDPALRAQYAFEVFGDQAKALMPLLNSGTEGIAALRTEADQLGLTIGTEQAAAAAEFSDAWNRIKRAVGGVFIQMGARLAPAMTDMAGRVLPWLVTGGKMVAAVMQGVAEGFVRGGEMMAQAIAYLREAFPKLFEDAAANLGGIKDAILSGEWSLAARIMWLSLKMRWKEGVDGLSREWLIWKKAFIDTFNAAMNAVVKKWHELQNMLSGGIVEVMAFFDSSIDAAAVQGTLDEMLQQQLRAVDANAERDQAARDAAFENDIGAVNKELEEARAEWQAAVSKANTIAEARANEPTAAGVADDRFTQLIQDLRAGDIATRVEDAVKAPSGAGDLRTAAGAGLLVGLINRQGTLDQRQVKLQEQLVKVNTAMLKIQKNGPKAIKI